MTQDTNLIDDTKKMARETSEFLGTMTIVGLHVLGIAMALTIALMAMRVPDGGTKGGLALLVLGSIAGAVAGLLSLGWQVLPMVVTKIDATRAHNAATTDKH